jgi:hypothetical protein
VGAERELGNLLGSTVNAGSTTRVGLPDGVDGGHGEHDKAIPVLYRISMLCSMRMPPAHNERTVARLTHRGRPHPHQ